MHYLQLSKHHLHQGLGILGYRVFLQFERNDWLCRILHRHGRTSRHRSTCYGCAYLFLRFRVLAMFLEPRSFFSETHNIERKERRYRAYGNPVIQGDSHVCLIYKLRQARPFIDGNFLTLNTRPKETRCAKQRQVSFVAMRSHIVIFRG